MRSGSRAGMVPAELTSFVGREAQIRRALALIETANPLTLVGPGGVGKTRLAQRLVRALRQTDPSAEVRWVSLTSLDRAADQTSVERTVAESLGAEVITERSMWDVLLDNVDELAGAHPGGRIGLLLVLDNCEHVIEQVGALVSAMLVAAPRVRIVATSRHPLACAGEQLLVVPPLTTPPDVDAETTATPEQPNEAMDLLLERAAAVGVAVHVGTGPDGTVAAELCRLLDGVPLAIELAAAGLRSQSVTEIVRRLRDGSGEERFELLSGGPRHGTHPMHHSLRATMDWSYELCTDAERTMWSRLSVFEDGWGLAAAEAVCTGDTIRREDVLRLLTSLVGKSVVTADTTGQRTRYRLLETLRQYGRTRVPDGAGFDDVRRRHRDHHLAVAAEAAQGWFGKDELDWLEWARTELPNLRAAWAWSHTTRGESSSGLELAVQLARLRLQFFQGNSGEMLGWLQTGLTATAAGGPSEIRAMAMAQAGITALCQGSLDVANTMLARCRAEVAETSPARMLLEGLHAFYSEGDPRSAAMLERASAAFEEAGAEYAGERHMALLFSAMASAWYADRAAALAITGRCVADAVEADAKWAISWAGLVQGIAHIWNADPHAALRAERPQRFMGDHWGTMYGTHMAAWATAELVSGTGDPCDAERVARILGGASRLRERYGVSIRGLVPFESANARAEAVATSVLGSDSFTAAYAEGHGLRYEQIVTLAFGGAEPAPAVLAPVGAVVSGWNQLTGTEKEIAVLAASGLTDQQIARRRICSVRTVEKHLEHVRRKLLVRSRGDIARWVPAAERLAEQ
ncbi:ATP-binding protein [Pseudonocardia sp. TRM90224]|uniref:ATP-binding protein n=1 Tax=Pseudonocardia sp. TRM90224 TaxID=2812678 RepID=UPI001E61102F|nr:LuxR C-terminal-related transcriptional regulator [Pseudonocardia sp. TRM90224]